MKIAAPIEFAASDGRQRKAARDVKSLGQHKSRGLYLRKSRLISTSPQPELNKQVKSHGQWCGDNSRNKARPQCDYFRMHSAPRSVSKSSGCASGAEMAGTVQSNFAASDGRQRKAAGVSSPWSKVRAIGICVKAGHFVLDFFRWDLVFLRGFISQSKVEVNKARKHARSAASTSSWMRSKFILRVASRALSTSPLCASGAEMAGTVQSNFAASDGRQGKAAGYMVAWSKIQPGGYLRKTLHLLFRGGLRCSSQCLSSTGSAAVSSTSPKWRNDSFMGVEFTASSVSKDGGCAVCTLVAEKGGAR